MNSIAKRSSGLFTESERIDDLSPRSTSIPTEQGELTNMFLFTSFSEWFRLVTRHRQLAVCDMVTRSWTVTASFSDSKSLKGLMICSDSAFSRVRLFMVPEEAVLRTSWTITIAEARRCSVGIFLWRWRLWRGWWFLRGFLLSECKWEVEALSLDYFFVLSFILPQ